MPQKGTIIMIRTCIAQAAAVAALVPASQGAIPESATWG